MHELTELLAKEVGQGITTWTRRDEIITNWLKQKAEEINKLLVAYANKRMDGNSEMILGLEVEKESDYSYSKHQGSVREVVKPKEQKKEGVFDNSWIAGDDIKQGDMISVREDGKLYRIPSPKSKRMLLAEKICTQVSNHCTVPVRFDDLTDTGIQQWLEVSDMVIDFLSKEESK